MPPLFKALSAYYSIFRGFFSTQKLAGALRKKET